MQRAERSGVVGLLAASLRARRVVAKRPRRSGLPREDTIYSLLIIPPAILLGVLFAYPIFDLLLQSVSSPDGALGYYAALLQDGVFRTALFNSAQFALLTGMLTAIVGYPAALLIASVRPAIAGFLLFLVMVPFWTSVLVRSYAWMILLGRHGPVNAVLLGVGFSEAPLQLMYNRFGVVVGMLHAMLPYMILPIVSGMRRLDPLLLAAGASLGASRRQLFLRVLLPLTFPAVLSGFVLVFVLSLGFFVTPALMGGPRDVVTAMVVHDQVTRQLAWGPAAATSVILLALTVGTLLICARLIRVQDELSPATK